MTIPPIPPRADVKRQLEAAIQAEEVDGFTRIAFLFMVLSWVDNYRRRTMLYFGCFHFLLAPFASNNYASMERFFGDFSYLSQLDSSLTFYWAHIAMGVAHVLASFIDLCTLTRIVFFVSGVWFVLLAADSLLLGGNGQPSVPLFALMAVYSFSNAVFHTRRSNV